MAHPPTDPTSIAEISRRLELTRRALGLTQVMMGRLMGTISNGQAWGYYESGKLTYAGRTRNGFTPAVRRRLFARFRGLEIEQCPFANLPEAKSGRWGAGLTAAKMKDCRWLSPVLVAQIDFLEWTGDNHLRHTTFVALRDDRPAEQISRE